MIPFSEAISNKRQDECVGLLSPLDLNLRKARHTSRVFSVPFRIRVQLSLMKPSPSKFAVAEKFGIAVRPSLLFAMAFALNTTPHEAAHATVAYLLGFSSTLFKMWVNPDAA